MRQDILLGLVVTEAGVAATQVISSPTAVAVFGINADAEGATAGGAVATPEGMAYKVADTDGEAVAAEAGVVTAEGAVVVDAAAAPAEDDADAVEEDATEEA
jgi:hypothetical protein